MWLLFWEVSRQRVASCTCCDNPVFTDLSWAQKYKLRQKSELDSNIWCTWLYCLFQLDTYEELMEVSAVEFSACGLFPVNVEQGLNVRHVSSPLTSNKPLRFLVMHKQWFYKWLIIGQCVMANWRTWRVCFICGKGHYTIFVKLDDKLIWQIDPQPLGHL